MKTFEYTGQQPFTGTLNGKDVLLAKGDTVDLDDSQTAQVQHLIFSNKLKEVTAPTNAKLKTETK